MEPQDEITQESRVQADSKPAGMPLQQKVQIEEFSATPEQQAGGLTPQQRAQMEEFGISKQSSALFATQGGLQVHRVEASKHLSQTGRRFFNLIEFDENERLVLEIRKHPFGLAVLWFFGIMVSLILVFVPVVIAAYLGSSSNIVSTSQLTSAQAILLIVGIILGFGGVIVTIINSILYKNNVIFVTSEKIAQVLYISLFHRKISQLSIGDIQDVTVRQDGIFPRIFNFGTLTIETSGEQMNYVFNYVPAPYESSKLIVGAHEENLKQYGN